MWGENFSRENTYLNCVSNNSVTFTENSVTFKLSGSSMEYVEKLKIIGTKIQGLKVSRGKTYKLNITPPSGYDIKVNKVGIKAGSSVIAYVTVDDTQSSSLMDTKIWTYDENVSNSREVNVTFSNSSAGALIYIYGISVEYDLLPIFNFKASAAANPTNGGTVMVELENSQIIGEAGATSVSTSVTFKATATLGSYEFVGWKTSANASTYESHLNPYETSITNSGTPGSTVTKSLVAIFAPVFNFAAEYEMNRDGGTVTATVMLNRRNCSIIRQQPHGLTACQ